MSVTVHNVYCSITVQDCSIVSGIQWCYVLLQPINILPSVGFILYWEYYDNRVHACNNCHATPYCCTPVTANNSSDWVQTLWLFHSSTGLPARTKRNFCCKHTFPVEISRQLALNPTSTIGDNSFYRHTTEIPQNQRNCIPSKITLGVLMSEQTISDAYKVVQTTNCNLIGELYNQ